MVNTMWYPYNLSILSSPWMIHWTITTPGEKLKSTVLDTHYETADHSWQSVLHELVNNHFDTDNMDNVISSTVLLNLSLCTNEHVKVDHTFITT